MTTISFTIDDTERSVAFEPVHGDPNVLFRDGQDRVAEKVEDLGFAFVRGAEPTYQELAKAYRDTATGLDLGDLSDRVEPVEPDSDPEDAENAVTLELVGPDDDTLEQEFTAGQNLGAVAAAVSDEYDVGVEEQVVLYPTSERTEYLATDTLIGDIPESTLYWEVTTIEDES